MRALSFPNSKLVSKLEVTDRAKAIGPPQFDTGGLESFSTIKSAYRKYTETNMSIVL